MAAESVTQSGGSHVARWPWLGHLVPPPYAISET